MTFGVFWKVLVHGEQNEMMRLKAALIRDFEDNAVSYSSLPAEQTQGVCNSPRTSNWRSTHHGTLRLLSCTSGERRWPK